MVRPAPLSRLYPSEVLDRGKPVSEPRRRELEQALLDQLADALAGMHKVYHYSLTNQERQAVEEHRLPPALTQPVEMYRIEDWNDDAPLKYAAWAMQVDERRTFADAL